MPATARDEMLAAIREALGGKDPVQSDKSATSAMASAGDDHARSRLMEQFESELMRVGGRVHYARDTDSVYDLLGQLAEQHGARGVVAWADGSSPNMERLSSLNSNGLEIHLEKTGGDSESFLQKAAQSAIGITAVDYGLADTGTLVLISGEGRARAVSLLPPVHVALLDPDRILPGLDELFRLLGGRRSSSAVTFITGPSRTADIELTLVVGVHGPQELHVVMLKG